MTRALCLVLTLLTLPGRPASAQMTWEPPPGSLSMPVELRPTVERELIAELRVASFAVILEETKLSDVQMRLGGTIGQRGDASEALRWLCFSGRDANGPWILWLESGAMHGGTVGGFQLRRADRNTSFDPRCHALPDSTASIALPGGIALSQSRQQVIGTFGRPTMSLYDTSLYVHQHQERVAGGSFTTSSHIALRFRDAILDAIDLWRVTGS
jgi:hypothetical protein